MNRTINVLIDKVHPDPKNPRQEFDPGDLALLEDSIKRNGILTPLSVEELPDGKYLLVDGERRYRSARKLKLPEVPVTILPAMSDLERLIKRFHLQEQHAQWSPWEKAAAISSLRAETGMTVNQIGSALGMHPQTIERHLVISELSHRAASQINQRKLPFEWILEMGKIVKSVEDEGSRKEIEDAIIKKIDDKLVLQSRELRKYRIAIKSGGKPIIKKIIENPKYTPNHAAKEVGMGNADIFNRLSSATSWINTYGAKIVVQKNPTIPARLHDRLVVAKKLIGALVDFDYEDPKETE